MLPAMSMVEVRVPNLDCHGCASKLKRALFKLKGVEEIEIEMEMQKVVVKGYGLEERKVLKAIKRAGKAAEPWPYPGMKLPDTICTPSFTPLRFIPSLLPPMKLLPHSLVTTILTHAPSCERAHLISPIVSEPKVAPIIVSDHRSRFRGTSVDRGKVKA
ncbi:unnamed protein product [Lactuca virosa]|uniref:HMA domain-containing protein n=1 Tax=Lactuca virosa TaxID=75947 RepID=A0AAU9N7F8_9ASTR|nr:unnamed protein product [Lactuca virosa]